MTETTRQPIPTPPRTSRPNPNLDAGVEEMWHSLLDGRAKHRYVSDYDPTSQDRPRGSRRVPITLATFNPDYLR